MTKRLWTFLALGVCVSLPVTAQQQAPAAPAPAPTGTVDPGEPKNQPQVAHDHDGDGVPDHSAEEHGGSPSSGNPWDGAVGPAVFIGIGLAALGAQKAISARRHSRASRTVPD
jgi:hypothetical protein